jgi:hypothetical protein
MYQGAYHEATGEDLDFFYPFFMNCYPFEFDMLQIPREMLDDAKISYYKSLKGIKEMLDRGGMEIRKGYDATTPEIPAYIAWKFKNTGSEVSE